MVYSLIYIIIIILITVSIYLYFLLKKEKELRNNFEILNIGLIKQVENFKTQLNNAISQSEVQKKLLAIFIDKSIEIKKDLSINSIEIQNLSLDLTQSNSNLVTHFSNILQSIDFMIEQVLSATSKAESDLIEFVDENKKGINSPSTLDTTDVQGRLVFITYIQKKYNLLFQKIIDELIITHIRKMENTDTLEDINKRIQEIISLSDEITEIAGGIELISLNANIEAAHAREYGLGFAVVAGEIRKLANQSESAAKRIRIEIKLANTFIKKSTENIKESMETEAKYLTSSIDVIKEIFIKMTNTTFQLIFDMGDSLTNSMGDSSSIKKGINESINVMQIDSIISKLDLIQINSLSKICQDLGDTSLLALKELESTKGIEKETLSKFKSDLYQIDSIVKEHFINQESQSNKEDITFF